MTDILNLHFEVKPSIAVRRIKDELFFITPFSAQLHTLNESGVEIWDYLLQGKTPAQIIEILVEETDGERINIREDIIELVNELLTKGILRAKNE